MEKIWFEISLKVPAAAADIICNELAELGSEGVTVEERQLDTFILPDPDEISSGNQTIKAYFEQPADIDALLSEIEERILALSPLIPGLKYEQPQVRKVRNEDWAENWKQHFSAVRIGPRLVVKPSWEDFAPRPADVVINLDPGMAFGTGTHGTTRLCLEELATLFEGPSAPQRVLDVGTGSGILALAAAALGAPRVLGCDIEEQACLTASENAAINGLGERVEITGAPLETLEGDFDLVLANILAEENIRLASELVGRLAPGGCLILSGILREKEAAVIEGFAGFGLTGPSISRHEEWVCLRYHKEA